jgi:hypothetical protein
MDLANSKGQQKAKSVHTKDGDIGTLEEICSGLKQQAEDPSTPTFSKCTLSSGFDTKTLHIKKTP